ncbi:unnamed protein product [Didymodactylos carnosus]|uniref:NAD(P)(+)--arginine ADP-ribosyltransferase n=2 Tax=Didymodactylos carnosus TaxID=1234261 RepID=A0A814TJG3_9BILA|nr:unnamed protein product [Didymodactylos carnosus]CAF3925825.1 unnamed protein product [Didymodactylos carnosus]
MATKSPSNSGAGSNIPKRKQNLRFSDIGNLPHQTLLPIDGYQHRKLLPLELALKSVTNLQPNVDQKVEVALHNCLYLSENLTQDESAAIQIYTMEWAPHETCVYYLLNQLLRLEDREPLKPWFNYLKLILTGLYKLASFKGTVWRGVKLDLSREYPKDKVFIWWGFSSCTESLEVLQSEHFLGKTGHRTLFSIECLDGKEIQRHSYLRKEREILLLPGRKFRVKGLVEMAPNAHVIQLIEIIPKFPLLADPFVTSEPVLMGGEKRTTSTSLLSKPGYFTADDRDGSRSTVEEIITQHRSSAVVEIYRQQLNNRDMELLKNELRSNESWSKLDLSFTNITENGVHDLCEGLRENRTLSTLHVYGNRIADSGAISIAQTLKKHPTIKDLSLVRNDITDDSCDALGAMLKVNYTLERLVLSENDITDVGIEHILHALANVNDSLKELDLRRNCLTDRCIDDVVQMLQHNRTLTYLDVRDNKLSKGGKNRIEEAAQDNDVLTDLYL